MTKYAVFVVLLWIVAAGVMNIAVPQLEQVEREHSRSFFAEDSPAVEAAVRMGSRFNDSTTNNVVYIVLESSTPLGARDQQFYQRLITQLRADQSHVASVMDLWTDSSSAGVALSGDHRAVVALVRLSGQIGDALATKSVAAVRHTLSQQPRQGNLSVFLAGPGATVVDEFAAIEHRLLIITAATVAVIALLLLAIYRSVVTCAVVLSTIGLALATARPIVAALGEAGTVEVSTFSVSLMAAMVLGAGTDYAIFIVGRYHEHRRKDASPTEALEASYAGVAPVVVASGLTVAIALCCLALSSIGLLRSAGIPCAIAVLTTVAASLTLTPALLALAGRFGWCEPRPTRSVRRWRRLGTAVVRWPKPLLAVSCAALVAFSLPLAIFSVNFDERQAQPPTTQSNVGYRASDRHFPADALLPQYVMIETDHDMRNPGGLLAIENITRRILAIPGVRVVQSASRPTGSAPVAAALTDQAGRIGHQMSGALTSLRTARGKLDAAQNLLARLADSIRQLHSGLGDTANGISQITAGAEDTRMGAAGLHALTERISVQLTPLRDFVNGTPDCPGNPICSLVSQIVDPVDAAVSNTERLDAGTGRLSEGSSQAARALTAASAAISTTYAQMDEARSLFQSLGADTDSAVPMFSQMADYLTEMASDFADSPDRGFYLPAAVFDKPEYQVAERYLFSSDGHATRLLVFGEGSAWSRAAGHQTAAVRDAVHEATKEGTLKTNTVGITGAGAYTADLESTLTHDLRYVALVALGLILVVVLSLIRSPVAAVAVVVTVSISYLSALGVTVALWTGLGHQGIHWAVIPLSFIALVAVGTDYNLLFTVRLKEEVPGGLNTGIIRTFAGTGGTVTLAGIVFALTMLALLAGGVSSISQIGTAVGVGLLIDTLVVRAVVLPACARLLGRWFWWPHHQPPILSPSRR